MKGEDRPDQDAIVVPEGSQTLATSSSSLISRGLHDLAFRLEEMTRNGTDLGRLGRHDEAIDCFDKVLALNPHDAHALSCKGICLGRLGRFKEALGCLDSAIEMNVRNCPNEISPIVWFWKGLSLDELDRFEEAITSYDRVLETDPHHFAALMNKAAALSSLGRGEDSLRCYGKAVELFPNRPSGWHEKGKQLARLDRLNEALDSYNRALELDSGLCESWGRKGAILLRQGRYLEALECFNKTIELDREFGVVSLTAWYSKAVAFEQLGRAPDAVNSYERFLALEADPKVRQGATDYLKEYAERAHFRLRKLKTDS